MITRHFSLIPVATFLILLSACGAPDTNVVSQQQSAASVSCPALNSDPANATATYSNPQQGISFVVPYNASWGAGAHPVPAFEQHPPADYSPYGYVSFGPPRMSVEAPVNDCMVARSYQLTFLKPRTSRQAVAAIEGADSPITPATQTRVINGLTVVQYTDAGLCAYPTMEVIGQKYNYEFSTYCGQNSSEEWNYLENIVKSVKLTK